MPPLEESADSDPEQGMDADRRKRLATILTEQVGPLVRDACLRILEEQSRQGKKAYFLPDVLRQARAEVYPDDGSAE